MYVRPKPPNDDPRYKPLIRAMKKNGYKKSSLIEVLHAAQGSFGYLEVDVMKFVGHSLRVPLGRVYGVATFYHLFILKPKGKHTCVVCTGTACYMKGADKILDAIEDKYGVKEGETTPDDELSVVGARCLGSCGLAPIAVFDENIVGFLDSEKTLEHIEGMIDDKNNA
ncbi:MAG: bidirectional hydrogenase complex protein HoxE [Campylobacterales bacterium]